MSCSKKIVIDPHKKNMQTESSYLFNKENYKGQTLNVDFGNVKGNPKVIYYDTTCVISSSNGVPHILIASSEFDLKKIPESFQGKVFDLPNVNLVLSFDSLKNHNSPKYEIPEWMGNMRNLKYLRIEDAKIANWNYLNKEKLRQLILINLNIEDKNKLLKELSEFKNLKYLVHSLLFTPQEVSLIKRNLPKLQVLLQSEYNKKVDNGEIGYED